MVVSQQISNQIINFQGNPANIFANKGLAFTDVAVPTAVAAILGLQTAVEVKQVKGKEDKKNTIINNVLIGIAMVTGGMTSHRIFKNYLKNFKPGKIANSIHEHLPGFLKHYPKKDYLEAMSIPLGAGITGGVTGEITQHIFPVEDPKIEIIKKTGILPSIDYDSINQVSKLETVGASKSVDGTLATLIGYSVGRQKGIKNKVKKLVFELVSGVLVPIALLLPLTKYLSKIPPSSFKTLRGLDKPAKGAIVMGAGIGLSIAGKAAADWVNRKVTEKVVEHKLWTEMAKRRRMLLKRSVSTHNPFEKTRLIEQVNDLQEFMQKIKAKNK